MQVSVKDGTNAGWRKVKAQVKSWWVCAKCNTRNKYYWITCTGCGNRR